MKFNLSTNVIIENEIVLKLYEIIQPFVKGKIAVVFDNALSNSKYFVEIQNQLTSKFNDTYFYANDSKNEPTYSLLEDITSYFRTKNIQLIIAIGGGSTIDLGKGLAILMTNFVSAISLKGFPSNISDPLPLITIPSLIGSGAEISFNAVFIDESENRKLGINSRKNYPKLTIIDPSFTNTAPRHAKIYSAFDTLVHCIDSFGSVKASPISRMFSTEGFKSSFNVLYNNRVDTIRGQKNLAIGSIMGITALMNSGDGPTNGFAYKLGVEKKIPHGLAGAVFLKEVMNYNVENGFLDYSELLSTSNPSLSKEELSRNLLDNMKYIYKIYNIPTLKKLGLTKQDAEEFINGSIDALQGSFEGNPIKFDKNSAYQVINKLI